MQELTETPPQTESDDQAREPQGRRRRQSQQPANAVPLNIAELETKTREGLIVIAEEMGVEGASTLRKPDLIFKLLQTQAEARGNVFSGGFLEISDDGNYGFLRGESMLPGPHDIYVSQSQLRRFALRAGDYITGQVRHPKDNEKYYGLLKVEAVNGMDPEVAKRRPYFENLTAIFPREQLKLESGPENLTNRTIDLIAPIGRGQRGLIVSPPKAGKTMLLVGVGAIGRRTAHLAAAFGMRVWGIRRNPGRAVEGVERMGDMSRLHDWLPEADFVVLTAPLTPETRHMFDEAALRRMKPTAYLVNIGRGGTVDEAALVRGLQEGWLTGAGLDVFEQEPLPADSPLWKMPNVIITAHYSGATPEYHHRAMAIFLDNLRRYVQGEELRNVVDKRLGY